MFTHKQTGYPDHSHETVAQARLCEDEERMDREQAMADALAEYAAERAWERAAERRAENGTWWGR